MNRRRFIALLLIFFAPFLANGQASHWAITKVDPFWGANQSRAFVGACSPHGMVKLGPDCQLNKRITRYRTDLPIIGFSTNHFISHSGHDVYGDLLVTPKLGDPDWKNRAIAKRIGESASPGFYSATLQSTIGDISVGLTANQNIGRHLYKFHPNSTGATLPFSIMADVRSGFTSGSRSSVKSGLSANLDGSFTGSITVADAFSESSYTLYFSGQTNLKAPILRYRIDTIRQTITSAGKKKVVYTFDTTGFSFTGNVKASDEVELTVAISYKNRGEADAALARGLTMKFEDIRAKSQQAWEDRLSVFSLPGSSSEGERVFYSALYHTLLWPTDVSGNHPEDQYGESHFWDMEADVLAPYVAPLHGLIFAPDQRRLTHALLRVAETKGNLPNGYEHGNFDNGSVGAPTEILLSDAVFKGILAGLEMNKAWKICYKNALLASDKPGSYGRYPEYLRHGFCTNEVEQTLAFSYNDYVMSNLAGKLNREYETGRFTKKSQLALTMWDPSKNRFFSKDTSDVNRHVVFSGGILETPIHLLDTIKSMLGGPDKFRIMLDSQSINLECGSDLTFPAFYSVCSSPAEVAQKVKAIVEHNFREGPNGLLFFDPSGNLSAWYIWACLGMYPITGTNNLLIYPGYFTSVEMNISGGKKLKISGKGNKPYWNGKPLAGARLKVSDVLAGGDLQWR